MNRIAPYYKAVTGLLVPFLGSVGTALLDASDGGKAITTYEWITAAVLGMVAGGAVFSVSNKDPLAQHQHESVRPPNA